MAKAANFNGVVVTHKTQVIQLSYNLLYAGFSCLSHSDIIKTNNKNHEDTVTQFTCPYRALQKEKPSVHV